MPARSAPSLGASPPGHEADLDGHGRRAACPECRSCYRADGVPGASPPEPGLVGMPPAGEGRLGSHQAPRSAGRGPGKVRPAPTGGGPRVPSRSTAMPSGCWSMCWMWRRRRRITRWSSTWRGASVSPPASGGRFGPGGTLPAPPRQVRSRRPPAPGPARRGPSLDPRSTPAAHHGQRHGRRARSPSRGPSAGPAGRLPSELARHPPVRPPQGPGGACRAARQDGTASPPAHRGRGRSADHALGRRPALAVQPGYPHRDGRQAVGLARWPAPGREPDGPGRAPRAPARPPGSGRRPRRAV